MTWPSDQSADKAPALIDGLGRSITYMRLSVTDRCDLRCTYCMAEQMRFLPKAQVLDLEELEQLCLSFADLGIRKIRITGGEPLVRRGIMTLVRALGSLVQTGQLDEVTLTTNATQLSQHAQDLADAGIKRINVSLDTLDPEAFKRITRRDAFGAVMWGLDAADRAGLNVKINSVALRNDNRHALPDLIQWAHGRGYDIALIETMPLGDVEGDRSHQYVSLKDVRSDLESYWTLTDSDYKTSGPARYVDVAETGGRLGFITPISHNFCDTCNRIRVTCTGTLITCLGQEGATDLRAHLRGQNPQTALRDAIHTALSLKPKSHDFHQSRLSIPSVSRHMSMTGG
jgi:GTP 3',8-cyclase